jgi:hypothetical protein
MVVAQQLIEQINGVVFGHRLVCRRHKALPRLARMLPNLRHERRVQRNVVSATRNHSTSNINIGFSLLHVVEQSIRSAYASNLHQLILIVCAMKKGLLATTTK